jgi:hypothetical protein
MDEMSKAEEMTMNVVLTDGAGCAGPRTLAKMREHSRDSAKVTALEPLTAAEARVR